jgi:Chondroitinase B
MDMYSFLMANGPLLAVIGILTIIMAIIILARRYLRNSPSCRKVIITAGAIPIVLLSVSTFVACNSANNTGNAPTRTPLPTTSGEASTASSPQPSPANAIYASPGDNLQDQVRNLSPGQTLVLRDGFYANQGLIMEKVDGTTNAPITIMAEHDGKAIIDGGGSNGQTVWIHNSSYIIVQGIVAQHGQEPVVVYNSDHITIRRVTAHDAAPGNYHVFDIEFDSTDVLVEDCAGWGRGRYIFIAYKSTNVTFRRDWAYWEHQENFPDAPRAAYSAYSASNITFENDIGIGAYPRPGIHDDNSYNAVYETASDSPPADNVKYIGDIFYNNMDGIYFNEASGQNPQVINSYIESGTPPGPAGSTTNEKGTGFTWWNHFRGSITNSTFTNTPVAASLQSGSATITNTVFYNNGKAIDGDHGHSYADFWQNRSIGTNLVFTDKQVDPGYDTNKYGRGAYLFIPPDSPLKGAGLNGQDIGANIVYESVDGQLTHTPLWPWPMEDRIKAGTGMSVTWESGRGIWKTLDGVYPRGTSFTPPTSYLLASLLLSPLFPIILCLFIRDRYITIKRMKR